MHVPVMLRECLEYLAIRPDGVYLDATCGIGRAYRGDRAAVARAGLVLACDRDAESLELAQGEYRGLRARAIRFHQRFVFEVGTGAGRPRGFTQLDGLLADLGVSRYQLTEGERGFSLMADGPLGHAHGSQPGADGGRHRQLRIGKAARRLDLSVGRGKEEPEE